MKSIQLNICLFIFLGAFSLLVRGAEHQVLKLDDCAICLNSIDANENAVSLACNHYYHAACIQQMLQSNGLHRPHPCPLCRDPFSQDSLTNYTGTELQKHLQNGQIIKKYLGGYIVPATLHAITGSLFAYMLKNEFHNDSGEERMNLRKNRLFYIPKTCLLYGILLGIDKKAKCDFTRVISHLGGFALCMSYFYKERQKKHKPQKHNEKSVQEITVDHNPQTISA